MRRGEANQRTDVSFHIPNDDLKVPVKYPLNTLGKLSVKIIQPTEFIREYAEESDKAIPFLRAANVEDGHLNLDDIVFVDSRKLINAKDSFVDTGDILITRTGAKAGATCVVPELPRKHCVSSHSIRVIPRKDMVLSNFLEAFLLSKWGKSQITRLFTGAAQKQLQLTTVAKIQIPVPSLEVQQKLVSDLEAAREAGKRKLAEADALLAGIDGFLLERLGLAALEEDNRQVFAVRLKQVRDKRIDPPAYRPYFKKGIQIKTPLKSLGEIALVDGNSAIPPANDETLVSYVGLPECDMTEVREVAMRPYKEVKGRSVVRPGDILFARIEPSVFNKKYVFADHLYGHEQAYTSTEFYVVHGREDIVEQGYLYAMFFCSFVFAQVKGKTTGSSGRRRIDPEMFASLQIPLPDKSTQKTIAAEVTRRREEARRLRAEAAKEWEEAKKRFEERLLG